MVMTRHAGASKETQHPHASLAIVSPIVFFRERRFPFEVGDQLERQPSFCAFLAFFAASKEISIWIFRYSIKYSKLETGSKAAATAVSLFPRGDKGSAVRAYRQRSVTSLGDGAKQLLRVRGAHQRRPIVIARDPRIKSPGGRSNPGAAAQGPGLLRSARNNVRGGFNYFLARRLRSTPTATGGRLSRVVVFPFPNRRLPLDSPP